MAGKPLPSFLDFVTATGETILTPTDDIICEDVQQTYTIRDALKGRGIDEIVQSGSKITDRIQLKASSAFQFYNPNDTFSPALEDTLSKLSCEWAFAVSYWCFTDHETELNEGDKKTMYKRLKKAKQQAARIGMYNGIEAALWAAHSDATMEAASPTGARRPYSLRSFITEDGLAPAGSTTIMGINPTNEPNWRNQVINYQASDIDGTLVSAFDETWRRLMYEAPETKEDYFKTTKYNRQKIYAPMDGWKAAVRILRATNDRNYPVNDLGYASDDPVYGRIPIKWAKQLDSVGYTTGQPRFFWPNLEYLLPIFHGKRYFYETPPINGGVGQPFTHVVFTDLWYNWFCRSRARQGIVVPV